MVAYFLRRPKRTLERSYLNWSKSLIEGRFGIDVGKLENKSYVQRSLHIRMRYDLGVRKFWLQLRFDVTIRMEMSEIDDYKIIFGNLKL